jgi:flagellar export protein FliJ
MKFRFRLQRALDFAHMRERKKQNQLNASLQREKILFHYLDETRNKLRESLTRMNQLAGTPLAAVLAQAVETGNEDARRLEQTIQEEKQAQAKLKQDVLKLVMRRKALETLKEKRHADFRIEQRVHDQKLLDEVSTINWQRVKHGAKE